MATIYAIKGLLLEEVLLNLLQYSGYKTVMSANNDPTLKDGHSGLEVKGRGSNHQIDAIADFELSPPFSNPIRLLLEAKFYNKNIGIPIVRNAIGVLKDVNEYWVSNSIHAISKSRYHYQYAIFTSSTFTKPAQSYAFAQDIYLIKLENNKYFLPIIDAISRLTYLDFNGESDRNIEITLKDLRSKIRTSLTTKNSESLTNYFTSQSCNVDNLMNVYTTSIDLGSSYLGILANRFPIFLVPNNNINMTELINNPKIRICWDDEYWYIVKDNTNCNSVTNENILFSFDLPLDLFNLYANNNLLTKNKALDLKQEFMSDIKIIFRDIQRDIMVSVVLELDNDWINQIRHSNQQEE